MCFAPLTVSNDDPNGESYIELHLVAVEDNNGNHQCFVYRPVTGLSQYIIKGNSECFIWPSASQLQHTATAAVAIVVFTLRSTFTVCSKCSTPQPKCFSDVCVKLNKAVQKAKTYTSSLSGCKGWMESHSLYMQIKKLKVRKKREIIAEMGDIWNIYNE
ncbi:hypothetical protein [Neisseria zalophi]|uniref:hypothetical protein n=1 Tax=Neisseria zalophi TaxID=640030 RepID=UPI001243AF36|nr:hypothetical protein [Neisseria zalophi]